MTTFTRVNYVYRDASNYKQFGSVLLEGTVSDDDRLIIEACLDDGDGHFIPEQIGWPHPGHKAIEWPSVDDHCFAELDMEDLTTFEVVRIPRTDEKVISTVETWVKQMLEAKALGWNVGRYGVDV